MRTVIILRGLPGCGKSTLAKLFTGAVVVSMDDFWSLDGPYRFDHIKLDHAVAWTKAKFETAIDQDEELIVLDNTNTREWEYLWFKNRAEEIGYTTHLVEVQRGLFECFGAGRHPVPFEKIVEMAERFERPATMTLEAQVKMLLIEIAKMKVPRG